MAAARRRAQTSKRDAAAYLAGLNRSSAAAVGSAWQDDVDADYDADADFLGDYLSHSTRTMPHYDTFTSTTSRVNGKKKKLSSKLLKMLSANHRAHKTDLKNHRQLITKSLVLNDGPLPADDDEHTHMDTIKSSASVAMFNSSKQKLNKTKQLSQISNGSTSSGCSSGSSSSSGGGANQAANVRLAFLRQQHLQQPQAQQQSHLTFPTSPLLSSASSNSMLTDDQLKSLNKLIAAVKCSTPLDNDNDNDQRPAHTTTNRNSSYIHGLDGNAAIEYDLFNLNLNSKGPSERASSALKSGYGVVNNSPEFLMKTKSTNSVLHKFGSYLKSSTVSSFGDKQRHTSYVDQPDTEDDDDDDDQNEDDDGNEDEDTEPDLSLNSEEYTDNKNTSSSSSASSSKHKGHGRRKRGAKLNKRDSGIISDIFHLGSMNNLKHRLNNATQSIRNSFSVFSLKQASANHNARKSTTAYNAQLSASTYYDQEAHIRLDNTNRHYNPPPPPAPPLLQPHHPLYNNHHHHLHHSPTSKIYEYVSFNSKSNNNVNSQTFYNHNVNNTTNSNINANTNTNTTTLTTSTNINNNNISNTNNNNNNNLNNVLNNDCNLNLKNYNPIDESNRLVMNNGTNTNTNTINKDLINYRSNLNSIANSTSSNSSSNSASSSSSASNSTSVNNNLLVAKNAQSTLNIELLKSKSRDDNVGGSHNNNNNNNNNQTITTIPINNMTAMVENSMLTNNLHVGANTKNKSQSFLSRRMSVNNNNNKCSSNKTATADNSSASSSSSSSSSSSACSSSSSSSGVNLRRTSTFHTSCSVPEPAGKTTSIIHVRSAEDDSNRLKSFNRHSNSTNNKTVLNVGSNVVQKLNINNPNPSATSTASASATTFIPGEVRRVGEVSKMATKYESTTVSTHKHQKIVVQASTNDLLRCLVNFLTKRCSHLIRGDSAAGSFETGKVDARDIVCWLRSADRILLTQGWQEIAFMNPVNVVFVYLLVKQILRPNELKNVHELRCSLMTCLYLAFSYMGNEISYPLKPFLVEENRDVFWQRVVGFMNELSASMLRVNQEPRYFTELFYELKSFSTVSSIIIDNSMYVSNKTGFPKSLTVNSIDGREQQQQQQHHHNSTSTKLLLKESNTMNELGRAKLDSSIQANTAMNREKFYQQNHHHHPQQQQQHQMNAKSLLTFANTNSRTGVKPNCFNYLNSNDQNTLPLPSSLLTTAAAVAYEAPQPIAYCI